MSLRLRHDAGGPERGVPQPAGPNATEVTMPAGTGAATASAAPGPEAGPSIGGWLGVLATMLPRRQAESIREELETHLRDRVRDLMVGGLNEAESTKRAIAELGEAAELAGKYRALQNEPRRRLAMYGTMFAAAGAIVALGFSTIWGRQPGAELARARAENEAVKNLLVQTLTQAQGDGQPALAYEVLARAGARQPENADVPVLSRLLAARGVTFVASPESGLEFKADVKFVQTPASEVLEAVEKFAKMPVQVNWGQLKQAGLEPKTPITLHAKQVGADVILRALNEATGVVGDAPIDWRAANGVLEVGLRNHFDKRELKLVIYDLESIIAARQEKYGEERAKIVDEVVKLVSEFVYPDGWRDNGGDLAKMTVVGDRMFVDAPERFHKQIKWMLDQLPGQQDRRQGAADGMDVHRYVIQHVGAEDALRLLQRNMAIKAIDFSKFTVDTRSNCVLGRLTAEQHVMVLAALGNIDVESAEAKAQKRSAMLGTLDERLQMLKKFEDDRAVAEASLAAPDVTQAQRDELQSAIKRLKDQEAACRNEISELRAKALSAGTRVRSDDSVVRQLEAQVSMLEGELSAMRGQAGENRPDCTQLESRLAATRAQLAQELEKRGTAVPADSTVYLSGLVNRPGVYAAPEGLTLRRLLVAAGGVPDGAEDVIISESANGRATVAQTVKTAELRCPDGPDPVLKAGQLVSVR